MRAFRWQWNRFKSYVGRPRLVVQDRPVILSETEICEHPLMVTGPQRSGTSLVRRMLNSHPDIACPPETNFFAHYARMMDDPLVMAGYDGLGFDPAQMRADLARKASELHEALRLGKGKRIWADKTPQHVAYLSEIDRLFDGRPRYLLVRRHPWDIAFSVWKRGWRLNEVEDLLDSALIHTRDGLAMMNAFAEQHPDRCASVEYRAICETPEECFTPALEKLGLAWHDDMLEFGTKPHNFGLEDPVLRGQKKLVLSEGAWRSWTPKQKARARELLDPALHGYSEPGGA